MLEVSIPIYLIPTHDIVATLHDLYFSANRPSVRRHLKENRFQQTY